MGGREGGREREREREREEKESKNSERKRGVEDGRNKEWVAVDSNGDRERDNVCICLSYFKKKNYKVCKGFYKIVLH